jgi:hypothetical protein
MGLQASRAVLCVRAMIIGALAHGDSFGALEIAVIVVSAALILLRHYAPIPVLAAAIGASIASVAVTDRPNVLIAVVVLLVFTVAVERDRRTGIYAGLAGIAGLLVIVGIQNSLDELPGPLLAALAWPALAVAAPPHRPDAHWPKGSSDRSSGRMTPKN